MSMSSPPKRKVTAKVNLSSRPQLNRSPSPLKSLAGNGTVPPSPSASTVSAARPKAKVNSVARKATVAATSPSPAPSQPGTRPASPTKLSRPQASPSIANVKSRPTSRAASRPNTANAELSPQIRHRSMLSDVGSSAPRARRVSGVVKPVSVPSPPAMSPSQVTDLTVDSEMTFSSAGSASIPKIKSKVTGMAKAMSSSELSPSTSTLSQALPGRKRTPSMASSVSLGTSSASPTTSSSAYPIATGSPAANPHRFNSVRNSPPPTAHHHYQPFSQNYAEDARVEYGTSSNRRGSLGAARVIDPTNVPLPPNSPPGSMLSFSSQSSAGYVNAESSGSSVHINGVLSRQPSSRPTQPSESGEDTLNPAERKEKAEAKTNRKIADLEITNKSLLAINTSLERTKNKQAQELRELRRRLRESRLILPPKLYRESMQNEPATHDSSDDSEESSSEDEPVEPGSPRAGETKQEATYRRVRILLGGLLETGRRALETTPDDFIEEKRKGTKVLNADELLSWQEARGETESRADESFRTADEYTGENGVNGKANTSVDDSFDDEGPSESLSAEEAAEVEAMTLHSPDPGGGTKTPPILISMTA